MDKRDVEDRIIGMGESIDNLEDELQYVRSQAEADRINKAVDTIQKRIDKLAKEYDIELAGFNPEVQ